MKYAVITCTLYFKDHERTEQMTIRLKEKLKNEDEKKQVEKFIISYRNLIEYANLDDFLYLLVENVLIETIFGQAIKRKELDVAKLDI